MVKLIVGASTDSVIGPVVHSNDSTVPYSTTGPSPKSWLQYVADVGMQYSIFYVVLKLGHTSCTCIDSGSTNSALNMS